MARSRLHFLAMMICSTAALGNGIALINSPAVKLGKWPLMSISAT